MPVTIIRTLIIYLLVVLTVRLMGKRQIGEMQPAELVITILLSEIAAVPVQDNSIPMLNSIAAILLLASLEIIQSAVSLKSKSFRKMCDGSPVTVVTNGKVDYAQLKKLRLTYEDLSGALRQKDVFDMKEVATAIVETNGAISVETVKPSGGKRKDRSDK